MRTTLVAAAAAVALAVVPRTIAGRGASKYLARDVDTEDALAREVAAYAAVDGPGFSLGSTRFEGEWALVTYQMTILGLGQMVLAHPELRDRYVPVMERAATKMMMPVQRDFATEAWGTDGLAALGSMRGDAWLGWPALALSMLRLVHPETPHAAVHDRIVEALARRLAAAPHGLIETYPGHSFPTDVAACAAAVALYDRATRADHSVMLRAWTQTYESAWVDSKSGYLWQQGDWQTGDHRDAPRGSGTAVGAYFLSFVDEALTAKLTDALARHERTVLGFGAIREYPGGVTGKGDIDSGPVILGVSIAATGFTLGAARATGRDALFVDLFRTVDLFGAPASHGGGVRFATGGPFGNAIMLAQLTARGMR